MADIGLALPLACAVRCSLFGFLHLYVYVTVCMRRTYCAVRVPVFLLVLLTRKQEYGHRVCRAVASVAAYVGSGV